MPRFIRPCLSGLLLITATAAVGQQLKPQSIRFEGQSEYSTAELLAAVDLKKGVVYTSDEMNRHAQQLLGIGVFDKVGYKFDGVDLVFQVTLSSQLYPILLDNLPLDAGLALDAALRAKVPLFHGKVSSDGTMIDDVRHALEGLLAQQGLQVQVSSSTSGVASTHTVSAIKFSIVSPPVRVGSMRLDGLSDAMRPVVTNYVRHSGGPYDTTKTAATVQRNLESLYANQGFAAAKVEVKRMDTPEITSDAIRIPLAVTIVEGRTYKLGSIHLAPGIPFNLDEIEKPLGPRTRLNPENMYLALAASAVENQYKAKGYLDCVVTPHVSLDEAAGIANYTLEAEPGPVYRLAFVKFEDVGDDLRVLLMRSWQMLPGDPFDESYVGEFMARAQKSDGALKQALTGRKATYDVRADPESHDVNLVIRLEKQ